MRSGRAAIERFQQLQDHQNPTGGNRFEPAIKTIFSTFVLVAIILGIVALEKFEDLRQDHDAFVADWSEYKSLRAVEAAKVEANLSQLKRLVQLLTTGKNHPFSPRHNYYFTSKLFGQGIKMNSVSRTIYICLVATVPNSHKKRARVPRRIVYTALNSSETFSCETNGQPLNSCLWGRTLNGQRQAILIDNQTALNGGRTSAKGILHVGDGLKDGKCSIKIESVAEQDVGSWSCTLVSQEGAIYSGEVSVTITSKSIRY